VPDDYGRGEADEETVLDDAGDGVERASEGIWIGNTAK
jgi:hypothetical protein